MPGGHGHLKKEAPKNWKEKEADEGGETKRSWGAGFFMEHRSLALWIGISL